MKPKTVIVGALSLAGLGALLLWGFGADPEPVDLVEIRSGEMSQTIDVDGKTRIRNVYEVAAPIAGRALRSPVEVGDRMIAGKSIVAIVQPVAPPLLDERSRRQAEAAVSEAEAALDVAASQVRQAEEDLDLAVAQFTRTAELVEREVATLTRLESAEQLRAVKEAALDAALSGQSMAEAALARARAVLTEPDPEGEVGTACCISLHAPTDGVVLSVASMSERPVAMGTPLLTLGQPEDLEIVADILSADAVRLSPGSRAIVERWGGPQPLEAILRRIEPSARTKVSALGIEEQRVNVVFDLLSPPAERPGLGDGFAVFLRIVEWRSPEVVQVPLSALFRNGETWSVFLADKGTARLAPVSIGRKNRAVAEVLEGLSPGDRVITHPGNRISDGLAIVDRADLE